MNTRKVKPASEKRAGFEHVSGCFKCFFIFSVKFLLWTGLMLMRYGGKDKMFEFKLFSVSSLFFPFSDFSSPLSLTRLTSLLGLRRALGRGVQKSTGEKYDMKFLSGLNELHEAEFYMNCSSQPSMVHWLSSSNFPCSLSSSSRYGDIRPNLTSSCPTPQNPYIF